jgi:hypothetical protein
MYPPFARLLKPIALPLLGFDTLGFHCRARPHQVCYPWDAPPETLLGFDTIVATLTLENIFGTVVFILQQQ